MEMEHVDEDEDDEDEDEAVEEGGHYAHFEPVDEGKQCQKRT